MYLNSSALPGWLYTRGSWDGLLLPPAFQPNSRQLRVPSPCRIPSAEKLIKEKYPGSHEGPRMSLLGFHSPGQQAMTCRLCIHYYDNPTLQDVLLISKEVPRNAGNVSLHALPLLAIVDSEHLCETKPWSQVPMCGCVTETWELEQLARCSYLKRMVSTCRLTERAQEKMTLRNQQRYAVEGSTGPEGDHHLVEYM